MLHDFGLERLDPTQRCFAKRVITWAEEVIKVYKDMLVELSSCMVGHMRISSYHIVSICALPCASDHPCISSLLVQAFSPSKDIVDTSEMKPVPQLRAWLGGSAGSGKSTTLKTCVAHVRMLFREAKIPARVALTAYTGVAAFNMSFGAKTACSTFSIFPHAKWSSELKDEALRKLEAQWSHVVLLIVDEISFIGAGFLARMHHRMQQAKREYFAMLGMDPNAHIFGDCSILLIGDFGQLEPIGDVSLVDSETTYKSAPKGCKAMWSHVRMGRDLFKTIKEAWMLRRVHRSKDDIWWTESCLRLRDFTMTKEEDYNVWQLHDLDRGHLTEEQKTYFENEAESRPYPGVGTLGSGRYAGPRSEEGA